MILWVCTGGQARGAASFFSSNRLSSSSMLLLSLTLVMPQAFRMKIEPLCSQAEARAHKTRFVFPLLPLMGAAPPPGQHLPGRAWRPFLRRRLRCGVVAAQVYLTLSLQSPAPLQCSFGIVLSSVIFGIVSPPSLSYVTRDLACTSLALLSTSTGQRPSASQPVPSNHGQPFHGLSDRVGLSTEQKDKHDAKRNKLSHKLVDELEDGRVHCRRVHRL